MSIAPLLSLFFCFFSYLHLAFYLAVINHTYLTHGKNNTLITMSHLINSFIFEKKKYSLPQIIYTLCQDLIQWLLITFPAISTYKKLRVWKPTAFDHLFHALCNNSFTLETLRLASVRDWKFSSLQDWSIDIAWGSLKFWLGIYIKRWHHHLAGG